MRALSFPVPVPVPVLVLVLSCATAQSTPELPRFLGVETEHWLVHDSGPVGRDDVLPAFEAGARNYGCSTEHLGADSSHNIYGEMRGWYGISASCDEGTLAVITLADGGVRIGCAKPLTLASCDLLLRNIAQPR